MYKSKWYENQKSIIFEECTYEDMAQVCQIGLKHPFKMYVYLRWRYIGANLVLYILTLVEIWSFAIEILSPKFLGTNLSLFCHLNIVTTKFVTKNH